MEVMDLFNGVGEAPIQREVRITGESVQQEQSYNSVGVVIDWFERNPRAIETGIIRSNFGERFSFTERDVVSGEPKVGRKVSFVGHPAGNVWIAEATTVVVDPPTPRPEQAQQPIAELTPAPETNPVVQQAPTAQPEDDLYGQVIFYGDGMNSGMIEADGVRYKFEATDVIRGIPSQGSFAKFNVVDGHAVSVVIA